MSFHNHYHYQHNIEYNCCYPQKTFNCMDLQESRRYNILECLKGIKGDYNVKLNYFYHYNCLTAFEKLRNM